MFHTPITKLLTEMSAAELEYWRQKHNGEFLGDERGDYRMARLEAAVMNYSGKSLKDGVSVSPLACMPFVNTVAETDGAEVDVDTAMSAVNAINKKG